MTIHASTNAPHWLPTTFRRKIGIQSVLIKVILTGGVLLWYSVSASLVWIVRMLKRYTELILDKASEN